MQIDRETLEEVEADIAKASEIFKRNKHHQPEKLPDAEGFINAALARLRKAMEDENQPQTYDYYGCAPMEAKDG